jgi:type IX secretion system PorP/SprF family membrane protein
MRIDTTTINKLVRQPRKSILLALLVLFGFSNKCYSQLYPVSAQYYTNEYLGNPALAGLDPYLKASLSFRKQWSAIPGSPITQELTADYGFKRVGLGLNIHNSKEGLYTSTRAVGTYAYHLPLNQASAFSDDLQALHFGFSIGVGMHRILDEGIIGDQSDISVIRENAQKPSIEGNIGIAYTSNTWNVQAAIPNLPMLFVGKNKTSDFGTSYIALSYKISSGTDMSSLLVEPKICFRGVSGFKDMWDAGSNFTFANSKINVMAIYHSTRSTTYGIGMNYSEKFGVSCMYTTTSAALRQYGIDGDFEISLKAGF